MKQKTKIKKQKFFDVDKYVKSDFTLHVTPMQGNTVVLYEGLDRLYKAKPVSTPVFNS